MCALPARLRHLHSPRPKRTRKPYRPVQYQFSQKNGLRDKFSPHFTETKQPRVYCSLSIEWKQPFSKNKSTLEPISGFFIRGSVHCTYMLKQRNQLAQGATAQAFLTLRASHSFLNITRSAARSAIIGHFSVRSQHGWLTLYLFTEHEIAVHAEAAKATRARCKRENRPDVFNTRSCLKMYARPQTSVCTFPARNAGTLGLSLPRNKRAPVALHILRP